MSAPSAQTFRRYALTISVAAITATGAWYGAGLKTQQEIQQEKKVLLEASPAERIEQLEAVRAKLVKRKTELEKKIGELTMKKEDGVNGRGKQAP